LKTVPFEAGFFVTVPCDNADEVGLALQKEGIFTVPVGKGLRVSIASISEAKCSMLPPAILKAINQVNG
jgi:aromatic-amino-acid transaminase